MIHVLTLSLEMVAILQIVSTLAVIFGIAVSMRAHDSGIEAQGGLILAWAGMGASLVVALAVQMVTGQTLLLKGLAVSICFLLFYKSPCSGVNMPNLINNIPETVKQLGSMYVATLVMGLGVALPASIGWTCILI